MEWGSNSRGIQGFNHYKIIKMNIILIIANILVVFTFIAHTYFGDREYMLIEPKDGNIDKQEKWTMGRGAFHIVSADFLLASVGLFLINFTSVFTEKKLLLDILAIYFLLYGLGFLIAVLISKKFSNNLFKLAQWILMFLIAGLIYWGSN
jgi:hypothetical protein